MHKEHHTFEAASPPLRSKPLLPQSSPLGHSSRAFRPSPQQAFAASPHQTSLSFSPLHTALPSAPSVSHHQAASSNPRHSIKTHSATRSYLLYDGPAPPTPSSTATRTHTQHRSKPSTSVTTHPGTPRTEAPIDRRHVTSHACSTPCRRGASLRSSPFLCTCTSQCLAWCQQGTTWQRRCRRHAPPRLGRPVLRRGLGRLLRNRRTKHSRRGPTGHVQQACLPVLPQRNPGNERCLGHYSRHGRFQNPRGAADHPHRPNTQGAGQQTVRRNERGLLPADPDPRV